LGNAVSSITHPCGSISPVIRRASRRRTGVSSHGESVMNCCNPCSSPSGSRAAIGWIDFLRPSNNNPRTYSSAFARWSQRTNGAYTSSANSINAARCPARSAALTPCLPALTATPRNFPAPARTPASS
jgi:hypothetical protein